jgi:hypothetical protein
LRTKSIEILKILDVLVASGVQRIFMYWTNG